MSARRLYCLKGQTPVGVGPIRQGPGLWPRGCNRRHTVDYQALKVQHWVQHLCNRGATFCPFLCPSHFDEFFGFPWQGVVVPGPQGGGFLAIPRTNPPNGSCHSTENSEEPVKVGAADAMENALMQGYSESRENPRLCLRISTFTPPRSGTPRGISFEAEPQ